MKIDKNTVVTLRYKIATLQGQVVQESKSPMVYLHGGYDNTFPKVEAALDGQTSGFLTTLQLAAEDAFGQRDEGLVKTIAKADFPPGIKVGGQLEGRSEDGQEQLYKVVKIKGPVVHLDANHPLAGLALRFTVKVVDVRAATEEEIAHKHVHGEHGHHH